MSCGALGTPLLSDGSNEMCRKVWLKGIADKEGTSSIVGGVTVGGAMVGAKAISQLGNVGAMAYYRTLHDGYDDRLNRTLASSSVEVENAVGTALVPS